jgi:hypothetical protein
MTAPLLRGTPRDISKAQAASTLSERLYQEVGKADATIHGILPAGWRALVGPEVDAHDTHLLVEVGSWLASAALRSGCSEVLKKLMIITASDDQNATLLTALGVKRHNGVPFIPIQLANNEEQIRLVLRAMTEATLNRMVLEIGK